MPYHIYKTKSKIKPFGVVLVSRNGEVLSSHSLKTKQTAWKNIKAQTEETMSARNHVQDDTFDKRKLYSVNAATGEKLEMGGVYPKYIPGINKNKVNKPKKQG